MNPPDPDVVVSTLQRAKEYLAEHGWHAGGLLGPDGSRCALGALAAANRELEVYVGYDALLFTSGHTKRYVEGWPVLYEPVTRHNDQCLHSLADALDWFDRAIQYAKDQSH